LRCIALCGALALCAAAPLQAKTLRWAARGDAQSMDAHAVNEGVTNNINNLVFDTLVERARDQTLVPALATRWAMLNDTTWRFTLRPGVSFHDGTPFTADDVVFSIERATIASWKNSTPLRPRSYVGLGGRATASVAVWSAVRGRHPRL